ncbi:MAG: hypothetical protein EPO24_12080 [Bacteroidetes bacterium]|nr:MAG: hypothetical protein EPO24_12080 [Bacteroidota bacterium]
MNCKEVSELLPVVLDGELRPEERPSIESHLNECATCRNELELHSMAKRIVQLRLQRVPAPPELTARLFDSVQKESEMRHASFSWRNVMPFHLTWKPVAAFGVVLVALAMVYLLPSSKPRHAHTYPYDADIIHQTFNNFDKLVAGTLMPQISSNDYFDVQQFFAQKASFKVEVIKMNPCKLKGGMFSKYNNAQVAHLVYDNGGQPIYVYQVNLRDILDENPLMLPCDVKEELLQTGWYIRSHSTDCTMILRLVDSTVCCAVADLPKEELLSYLNDF